MTTNRDYWREMADRNGLPLRTLQDVKSALVLATQTNAASAVARLMLRRGRLTEEARAYVAREYPQA